MPCHSESFDAVRILNCDSVVVVGMRRSSLSWRAASRSLIRFLLLRSSLLTLSALMTFRSLQEWRKLPRSLLWKAPQGSSRLRVPRALEQMATCQREGQDMKEGQTGSQKDKFQPEASRNCDAFKNDLTEIRGINHRNWKLLKTYSDGRRK